MNRQNWSHQQDNALIKYVQKLGVCDWTSIAQGLREECKTSSRTGKQCRQRWYNHLTPSVNKKTWTSQQQTMLFQTHRHYGNKWKDIAKQIQGRTDNDIKNHFYSTLRRSLRRLNKIIGQKNSTSQIRQIKPSVLTTIMDYIYKHDQNDQSELVLSLKDLPMLILEFASFKPKKGNFGSKLSDQVKDRIQTILNLVTQFNKSYCKEKKESKQYKNKKVQFSPKKHQNNKQKQKERSKSIQVQAPQQILIKDQYISEQRQQSMEVQQEHYPIEKNILQQQNENIHEDDEISKYITYVKTQTEVANNGNHHGNLSCSTQLNKAMNIMSNFLLPHPNNNLIMFDDYYPEGELPEMMQNIEDPSAFEQESHVCGLEVIGKHWSPPEAWERLPSCDVDQIDQIFQMNYDNNNI